MVAFNLVDMFYVGKLGQRELAALSFTFPVVTVIFSMVQGLGIGATAIVSKSIGAGKMSRAATETTNSLFLGVAMALMFFITGLGSIDFTFESLGAEPDLIPLIKEYMEVWYFTVLFVVVPFIGNSAIRATGDAKIPSMIMLFAVFINAALDPLLIFGWGPVPAYGVKGAALATAISRFFTLILSLYVLYFKKNLIVFAFSTISSVVKCWKSILIIGIPTGLSRMITPISASIITALLASYGEYAVAAYGIGTRIEFLTASLLIALSASVSPFTGQNWGANRIDRIQKALKISGIFAVIWGGFASIFLFIFAENLAGIFSNDPQIIETTKWFLTIVPVSFGFQGLTLIVNSNLNTLNRPLTASILIVIQMFVIYIPLAYLGSEVGGINGIFFALLVAYLCGGTLSYFTSSISLKRMIT